MPKTYTDEEKKALAKSLGTGGANKAAKALMSRQQQIDDAINEATGVTPKAAPKDKESEFTDAVSMVRKATKKPGGAMSRSNFA